jgi:hypothetical protein
MPTQLKSIVPTVFIVLIVVVGVADMSGSAVQAAECLGAPNAPSAKGQHWFYRIDRASQRKCWYQRAHDAQRAAQPPSPRNEVAAPVLPAPAAPPTASAQVPSWSETVPTSDRRRDTISDFSWPNSADQSRAVDREDAGVSTAIKQAGPTPRVVPMHKTSDARLSNATDGRGRNPTRLAAIASAAPAADTPASESVTFTPFRMVLLFIGIIIVPGLALSLIFRFGPSIWKKTSANDEEDRKIWRDSVMHNWAPSKLEAAEAPSIRPRKPLGQPVDPAIDPEQLLRKILKELQEPTRNAAQAMPAGRSSLNPV